MNFRLLTSDFELPGNDGEYIIYQKKIVVRHKEYQIFLKKVPDILSDYNYLLI
jgi:hypothetical protein